MNGTRSYRVFLPPAYPSSQKRYPVIYWFHGYEQSNAERDSEISAYVAAHEVIVADIGPVETSGEFPSYFPELASYIDKTLRTIPDRNHRAVTGYAMGGYMAFWIAGEFPDLVASASSFMGFTEASVGPPDLDLENRLEELTLNYDNVRTRLVTSSTDRLQFYHHRLNSIWLYARSGHETENYDADRIDQAIPKTFDFHLNAFANPLPKPTSFTHADVVPNFTVWGWEVVSDRKQPGFTVLENVSAKGFRSAVREWVPRGATIPSVKLSVSSAPLYAPASSHSVTYLRLRDGNLRRATQKADAQGRLTFDLDGDAYEVGVSAEPLITLAGYEIADAAWATAGQPVKLRVKFWNKGQARSATSTIQWQTSNPGVTFDVPSSRLFGLGPGESAAVPLTVTVADPARAIVRVFAVEGANRMSFEVPLFPAAEPAANFHLADGQALEVYGHAVQHGELTLGEGNGDGHAAPGESFVVLLPDSEFLRRAEVFTNDSCVENTARGADTWGDYDHAGASAAYSVPSIRADCPPGHVVHMLARVLIPNLPNHRVRYASIEFPVWYRKGEEPKK